MGSVRVHVMMAAEQRARYRVAAERAGQNLSEWLREAAEQRAEEQSTDRRFDTVEELDDYFAEIAEANAAEDAGPEEDWHLLGDELGDRVSPANPSA